MKSFKPKPLRRIAALGCAFSALIAHAPAQQSRITKPIVSTERFTLAGHIHPQARAEFDQGRVSPSVVLSHITLELALSDAQKADLDQLLAAQQDPASPAYRHWLTPEEYAARFGVSMADLAKITAWLESEGLTVTGIARGRSWVSVDGAAAQVEHAFQTELHQYVVNGVAHFANATEPSLPASFKGIIRGVRGLHDFRMRPAKVASRSQPGPDYTSSKGNHYLAPNDVATIYNINPIYNAGFDGAGQSIVIAGQTQINLSDIQQFRSKFNLPAHDPQITLVPNTQDPGVSTTDLAEADLDIEWAGAVARRANIVYVYASDVMNAVQYAIDQDLAPVVSTSYGLCETETLMSEALMFQAWAKQGNVLGITWFSASGDAGAADCDDPAHTGLAVDVPAAIPEVTGVGGTEFNEGAGQFWNAANDGNDASVLSYIPETSWNDSSIDGQPSASGGGASTYFFKPPWQTGAGVPNDNARHVPDVALNASADHDGYLVYTSGKLEVFGGTSVPTPTFAGIATLLNQYLVSAGTQSAAGLGNLNSKLYSLAQSASGVFHDTTTGDNIVTVKCSSHTGICTAIPVGYSAGPGYDQVTGLGSVDAYALAAAWSGKNLAPSHPITSMTLVASPSVIAANGTVNLTATVTSSSGITPAGSVTFTQGDVSLGSAALAGSAGVATATLTISGTELAQGSGLITADYSGDASTTASVSVTVSSTNSSSAPSIASLVNGASYQPVIAPGMILTVYGSELAPSIQSASAVPLPNSMAGISVTVNGISAPLYYVSPGQLNLQVPVDVTPDSSALLTINNNGQTVSQSFTIGAAAPGIFMDQNRATVPNTSAARGQVVTLYITGAGALFPPLATGAAPAAGTPVSALPQPVQSYSVTVAGEQATVFFIGVPSGLVGAVQINYQVPGAAPVGPQPVIVTIGGVSSSPAFLNVTN